jgi:hypothetical protein
MKRFYALFLVLVLGSLLAACSASTANIQSADLGTGYDSGSQQVTGATTTFAPTDTTIHLVVKVANAPDDTTVRTVWTAADVPSQNLKDQKLGEKTYATKDIGTSIDFTLAGPGGQQWPAGSYKVDVYLNDKLDRTLNYTVTGAQ